MFKSFLTFSLRILQSQAYASVQVSSVSCVKPTLSTLPLQQLHLRSHFHQPLTSTIRISSLHWFIKEIQVSFQVVFFPVLKETVFHHVFLCGEEEDIPLRNILFPPS